MSFVFAIWGTMHHGASTPEASSPESSVKAQNSQQSDLAKVHACCAKSGKSALSPNPEQAPQAHSSDAEGCCEGAQKCGGTMACCKILYDLALNTMPQLSDLWLQHIPYAGIATKDWISKQFRPPRPDRALFA